MTDVEMKPADSKQDESKTAETKPTEQEDPND